jgi:hypothetical protein
VFVGIRTIEFDEELANMVRLNQWEHEFKKPDESAVALGDDDDYWSDTDSLDKTKGTILTANKTVEQLSLEVGVETKIGNYLIKEGLKIQMKSPVVTTNVPKMNPENSSKTPLVTSRSSTADRRLSQNTAVTISNANKSDSTSIQGSNRHSFCHDSSKYSCV